MKVLIGILLLTVTCQASNYGYDQLCLEDNKGFLRHPHNCNKFIRCSHQRAYEFQCPSNLLWHHEIKTCDFSYRTQCILNNQTNNDKKSNIDVKIKENSEVNLRVKYKNNLTKNLQTQHGLAPKFTKLPTKVNIKRKCKTTHRENVITAVDNENVVKAGTESIIKVPTIKFTESYRRYKTSTINTTDKNNIVMENLISEIPLKEQKLSNNELIESTVAKFQKITTKISPDTSTVNTAAKTIGKENSTSTLTKLPNFIYSLYNSTRNPLANLKPEETNINNTEIKLIKKQNSTTEITADIKPTNLSETMLAGYSSESDTHHTTNSVNFTELKYYLVTLSGITESSLGILSLTENVSSLETTNEKNESIILTTKYPLNSLQSSTKTDNENSKIELLSYIKPKIDSVKPTEKMLTIYFSENSTDINSVQLPNTLKGITDKPPVKSTDEENENTIFATKHHETPLQSSITEYAINDIKAEVDAANLTEAMLTTYSAQNSINIFNNKIPEKNTSFVKLPVTLKALTVSSSLTDSTTVKTTDKENDNYSSTAEFTENLLNCTKKNSLICNRNLTAFETTGENHYVNLTETKLTVFNTETSTLNYNTTRGAECFLNVQKLITVSRAPNKFTKTFFSTSTAKSTDKVNENVSFNIKYPTYVLKSTENSANISNNNFLKEIVLPTTADNVTVKLTEATLADYARENITLNFYRSTQEEKINSDNLTQLTVLPTASSEITTGITTSLTFIDNSTVKLAHKESDNIVSTTTNPLSSLKKSTDTDNINISTNIVLPAAPEANSVSLTETMKTSALEPVNSTSTVSYYTNRGKNENITKKSESLHDLTTTKENSFAVTEPFTVKKTEHENKSPSAHDNFVTITSFSTKSSVTEPINLTEAVSEISKQNVSNIKPASLTPETNENHTNLETLPQLTVSLYVTDQTESTTSSIPTTSQNILSYDSIIQDPRLPFRSIDCRGTNNRRQLKAHKCYQYYQCFAGWAFLLNCHEGWRFQANEGYCVLDINRECDSEQ